MMIYPPINKLMENVDSRFTLVIEAAKRARQISDGAEPLVDGNNDKAVTTAINEIYQGKISYIK